MPRHTPEEQRFEAKELGEETERALGKTHLWQRRWILTLTTLAVVCAVSYESATWMAAALVLVSVRSVVWLIQRGHSSMSFSYAMREREYERVMDDIASLSKQVAVNSANLHELQRLMIDAKLIEDPHAALNQMIARMPGKGS